MSLLRVIKAWHLALVMMLLAFALLFLTPSGFAPRVWLLDEDRNLDESFQAGFRLDHPIVTSTIFPDALVVCAVPTDSAGGLGLYKNYQGRLPEELASASAKFTEEKAEYYLGTGLLVGFTQTDYRYLTWEPFLAVSERPVRFQSLCIQADRSCLVMTETPAKQTNVIMLIPKETDGSCFADHKSLVWKNDYELLEIVGEGRGSY